MSIEIPVERPGGGLAQTAELEKMASHESRWRGHLRPDRPEEICLVTLVRSVVELGLRGEPVAVLTLIQRRRLMPLMVTTCRQPLTTPKLLPEALVPFVLATCKVCKQSVGSIPRVVIRRLFGQGI